MKKIKLSDLSYETIEKNKNKKVKAAGEITLRAPLKEIPNEYWDKVEVENDWDREYQVPRENQLPVMLNHHTLAAPWDKRFKNQVFLDGFKKYANGESEFYIWRGGRWGAPKIKNIPSYNGNPNDDRNWYAIACGGVNGNKKLTQFLREANKMFHSGGSGKLKEREAFEFLKSIIDSYEIKANIKFTPNQEFTLGNWDKWKTSPGGEIEVSEQEAQAWQQCTNPNHQQLEQQITQLQQQNQSLQTQLNELITGTPRMEAKILQTDLPKQ
jgi:hypothetical protein